MLHAWKYKCKHTCSLEIAIFLVVVIITLENVKGEFESFGELPSERETAIENRYSTLNCVSRK